MLVVRPKRVWNIFQRFLRRLIGCEAKISNCSNLEHIHSETTELTYTFQNNSNNNSNNSNIQNTFTP